MTPFMLAVRGLLDGEEAPAVHTEPSATRSLAEAAHVQVEVRSLAEQLISEANAILREHGDVITLVDDSGPREFAFTMGFRDRSARVRTTMSARTATAQLVLADRPDPEPRQLSTEDDLRALVLGLLAGAPVH